MAASGTLSAHMYCIPPVTVQNPSSIDLTKKARKMLHRQTQAGTDSHIQIGIYSKVAFAKNGGLKVLIFFEFPFRAKKGVSLRFFVHSFVNG